MKYIEKKSMRYLLIVFLGICINSCTVDEPTNVTPKSNDQFVLQFSQFVSSEMTKVYSCKVGYNKGDFTPVSSSSFASLTTAYLTSLKADSALIAKPNVTINEIVAANNKLVTPGKAFWVKINITDKRALNDLIVSSTTLNNNVLVGALTGNVSQEAKNTFTTAIAAATTTRDALTTIDRQANDAITVLNLALKAFNDAIIK